MKPFSILNHLFYYTNSDESAIYVNLLYLILIVNLNTTICFPNLGIFSQLAKSMY